MLDVFVDGRELAGCSFLPHEDKGEVIEGCDRWKGLVPAVRICGYYCYSDGRFGFYFDPRSLFDFLSGLLEYPDGDTAVHAEGGGLKLSEIGTISVLLFLAKSWEECTVDPPVS